MHAAFRLRERRGVIWELGEYHRGGGGKVQAHGGGFNGEQRHADVDDAVFVDARAFTEFLNGARTFDRWHWTIDSYV